MAGTEADRLEQTNMEKTGSGFGRSLFFLPTCSHSENLGRLFIVDRLAAVFCLNHFAKPHRRILQMAVGECKICFHLCVVGYAIVITFEERVIVLANGISQFLPGHREDRGGPKNIVVSGSIPLPATGRLRTRGSRMQRRRRASPSDRALRTRIRTSALNDYLLKLRRLSQLVSHENSEPEQCQRERETTDEPDPRSWPHRRPAFLHRIPLPVAP